MKKFLSLLLALTLVLSLVLLGVDVVMDATLQLVRKGEAPLLEIQGVTPLGK